VKKIERVTSILDNSRNGYFHDDVYETLKEPTDYEPWPVNSLLKRRITLCENLLETPVKALRLSVEQAQVRWKTKTVKSAGPIRPGSPNASGISTSYQDEGRTNESKAFDSIFLLQFEH